MLKRCLCAVVGTARLTVVALVGAEKNVPLKIHGVGIAHGLGL
jgi:hypothetical protein